jgi:tRNA (guanine-N7-)-methyltransferase
MKSVPSGSLLIEDHMPVRSSDVFADIVSKLDNDSNAFVAKLVNAQNSGDLPVAMGPRLREFPGQWRSKFTNVTGDRQAMPLIVEIGCHTGHTLCDMAERHPEALFVGVDITFKRVIHTAERARDRGLKNIFVILANAGGLSQLFQDGEVDGFITFFPDPWVKKKHAHYRLYSEVFCSTVYRQLSRSGFLWLKTDQEPYFQTACEYAKSAGFCETASLPVFADGDFSSLFLRRFELKNLPWYGRKWTKFDA